jgi:hypothetical protein
MAKVTEKSVRNLLDEISDRLDAIEDLAAWLVRANQRFRKGQRVQFSPAAFRKGLVRRVKGGAMKGTVVHVDDGFAVRVLIDGYKHPTDYHHSFFEAVGAKSRRKGRVVRR